VFRDRRLMSPATDRATSRTKTSLTSLMPWSTRSSNSRDMTYSHRESAPCLGADEHAACMLALVWGHPTRPPTNSETSRTRSGLGPAALHTLAVEIVTLAQEVWHFSGRLFCTTCRFLGTQRREGPVWACQGLRHHHRELLLLSRWNSSL
jgi:hypothetical protein